MGRRGRYLTFEGQFESRVIGTFRIIRAFATLKTLRKSRWPTKWKPEIMVAKSKANSESLMQELEKEGFIRQLWR